MGSNPIPRIISQVQFVFLKNSYEYLGAAGMFIYLFGYGILLLEKYNQGRREAKS